MGDGCDSFAQYLALICQTVAPNYFKILLSIRELQHREETCIYTMKLHMQQRPLRNGRLCKNILKSLYILENNSMDMHGGIFTFKLQSLTRPLRYDCGSLSGVLKYFFFFDFDLCEIPLRQLIPEQIL